MSTNSNFIGKEPTTNSPSITPRPVPTPTSSPSAPQSGIPNLVKVMQSVKTNTPEAKLNETTISDGNGGRITLDDQTKKQNQGQNSTVFGNLANEKF